MRLKLKKLRISLEFSHIFCKFYFTKIFSGITKTHSHTQPARSRTILAITDPDFLAQFRRLTALEMKIVKHIKR